MKRKYDKGTEDSVSFFIGTEIEHTPALGMTTLFVVGVQDVEEIWRLAHGNKCQHIYFGANQSFNPVTFDDWERWDSMIMQLLNQGYWCTLDLDVRHVQQLHESPLCESRRFIPQISVKIPYLHLLNYNATIKIDDADFEASNPGVWCHPLSQFTKRESFTGWDSYTKDKVLK